MCRAIREGMNPRKLADADLAPFLSRVRSIAVRLARQIRGAVVEDLVADGTLGLVQALQRKPVGLTEEETDRYVTRRIKGAMLDQARVMSPAYRRLRAARRAHARVCAALGEGATPEGIAARMGLGRAEYEDHCRFLAGEGLATHLSFDDELAPSSSADRPDELARGVDLQRAWAELPPALREPLEMHYLVGVDNREIARRMGVHESRVSQLQRKGIDALRSALAPRQEAA